MYDYEQIVVPFVGGLDTKSDSKTLLPNKLSLLQNGEFTEANSVKKRLGYTAVAARTTANGSLDGDPVTCAALENGLVLLTKRKAYALNERELAWAEQGSYSPISYTQETLVRANAQQVYAEVATAGGVSAAIWEDSRGGVRAAVWDEASRSFYETDLSIASANAARPRAVAFGGVIFLIYVDTSSNNLKYKRITSWAVETSLAVAAADLATDLAAGAQYDIAVASDSYAVLAYNSDNSVTTGVRAATMNVGGELSNYVLVNANNAQAGMSVAVDGGVAYIAYKYSSGNTVLLSKYTAVTLTSLASSTTVAGAAYTNAVNVVVVPSPSGAALWVTVSGASNDLYISYLRPYDTSLTAGSEVTIRHAYLATQGFYDGDHGYVVLGHDSRSGIQDGYYLINHEGKLMGQMLVGEGAGILDSKDHLPHPRAGAADEQYLVPLTFKSTVDAEGDDIAVFEHKGIKLLTFDSSVTPGTAGLGRTLYGGGAQVWALGSGQPVEAGFTMFPDVVTSDIAHTGVAGNFTVGDVINYRFYYEWTLPNGERIRSGAITRTFTVTLAEKISIAVPSLTFTRKDDTINSVTDVAIVGYRTEANKSQLYYRITSEVPGTSGDNGFYSNDFAANSVTVTDNMTDANLISKEIDYRSVGELVHYSPVPGTVVAAVGSRLFVAGGAHGDNEASYSLLSSAGRPAEFTDFKVEDVAGHDPVRGAHHINGAPVLFKEHSIYVLNGDGPDNTNQDGGFYVTSRVTSDVGLVDPGSLVETPEGLMFKSRKGIYLLDQSLNVSYIGAEVEGYNDQTVVAATTIPSTNSVVFLTDDGSTLIYDYFYRSWGTFTNHEGLAAANLRGDTYCYLRSNGQLYMRSEDVYTDNGVPYSLKVRTAPIRPESLQGMWKVCRIQLLGDYLSQHRLKVSLYYNRDEAPFEVYTWDPSTVVSTDFWGDDDTWGSGDFWGGAAGGREYQHEHRPLRSKCQTISFEFEDIPGTSPGASYELTELAIAYLPWAGLSRLPATRKY